MSNPQPQLLGVNRRGSSGFHQRCLTRATVGRRQSYGIPKNRPVLLTLATLAACPRRRTSTHRYLPDCSSQAPITASSIGIGIAVLEIGDDHHVLREALRDRERLGERLEQEVSKLERRTNDDVAVVELPRHEAPAIPPIEQAVASSLGDTVELRSQAAEVRERHRAIVACQTRNVGSRQDSEDAEEQLPTK